MRYTIPRHLSLSRVGAQEDGVEGEKIVEKSPSLARLCLPGRTGGREGGRGAILKSIWRDWKGRGVGRKTIG